MLKNDSQAKRALFMVTLVYAVNFAVWTVYAALGTQLLSRLQLSALALGVLLAAPIFSGALGLFLLGRFLPQLLVCDISARQLIAFIMVLVFPALILLMRVDYFEEYLCVGLWLGLSGATLVPAVHYISPFFRPIDQGLALGVLGAGSVGAALSLLAFPALLRGVGWSYTGLSYAAVYAGALWLFWWLAPVRATVELADRDEHLAAAPSPLLSGLFRINKLRLWRLALYYYFAFGSFLSLILWLPHYYHQAYGLTQSRAMVFTVFFVLTSSMANALGGWLADFYGGRKINWSVFWVSLCCLFVLSYPPTSMQIHGIARDVSLHIEIGLVLFTGLIFVLGVAQGIGRGAVFKLLHFHYPAHTAQAVGFIALAGALGGASLPVFYGLAQDFLGINSACFMVLYGVLAVCMMALYWATQSEHFNDLLARHQQHNFLHDE